MVEHLYTKNHPEQGILLPCPFCTGIRFYIKNININQEKPINKRRASAGFRSGYSALPYIVNRL